MKNFPVKPLCAVLTCALVLSACAASPGSSSSDKVSTPSKSNSTPSSNTSNALTAAPESYDYTLAVSFDIATRASGNENGLYQIIDNENGYANLIYTDYAAASRDYVCSDPNCEHNTDSCTSYIENDEFSVFPVVCDEELLLIYSSYDYWETNEIPSRIECMKLNGENRHILCTLDSSIILGDGALVGNNEIVVSGYKSDDSGDSMRWIPVLGAVSLETGEFREIYALPDNDEQLPQNMFMRGVSDTGFILEIITIATNPGPDEPSTRIFELSFDGKTERDLLTYTGSSCFEKHNGKELVYLRFEPNGVALCRRNSQEEQEKVVVDNVCALPCIRETDQSFDRNSLYIVDFLDNYVLLKHQYDYRYDAAGHLFIGFTQYAINLDTGEAKEITLANDVMNDVNGVQTRKPINIVAKFGDSLLVDAVKEIVNGKTYRKTGIISVQDYLNSVPAYTMIQSPIEETLLGIG